MKLGIIIVLLVIFGSCRNESKKCKYDSNRIVDTTLYITFKKNNQGMKFYQYYPWYEHGWDGASAPIKKDENTSIYSFNYCIDFVSFTEANMPESYTVPELGLIFSKKALVYSSTDIYNHFPNLYSVFSNVSSFASTVPDFPQLKDTAYMDGIAIEIAQFDSTYNYWYTPSTYNVFEYYKNNKDSIDTFFKDCFVKISNVEAVCDNVYLVEGTFRAKLMYPQNDENPIIIELTDGKFKFIRRE